MNLRVATLLLAISLLSSGCGDGQQAASTPPPSDGSKTPITVQEVRFPVLNKAISELQGKVVVVDFWATWCAPCVKKFPHLVEIQRKFGDKGLVCVSVSLDKRGSEPLDLEKVKNFLVKQDARFPNFAMADFAADHSELHKRFGIGNGIPYLVVLDRSGQPVWNSEANVKDRREESQELDDVLEKLVAEKQ